MDSLAPEMYKGELITKAIKKTGGSGKTRGKKLEK